jgi:3',5'-cyclic AMP phosphodiesterase CpdA
VRTVAHISDLHFGRDDPQVTAGLVKELARLRPSLVIASGDLTQRARRAQFRAAARFLAGLPAPVLVVPGNHDIPLFDVLRRLFSPLGRYRRHITPDLTPVFDDGELFVVGLNTARPHRWKDGEMSPEQIAMVRERFEPARPGALRVLVTHHPLVPRPDDLEPALVRRGSEALKAAADARVDLTLAGHLHRGFLADVRPAGESSHAVLVVQAGTAISNRRPHEPNSYNLLTVDPPRLEVQIRTWDGAAFAPRESIGFRKQDRGWSRT